MTPPRKKPFNEVTYDEEHPKRMRLAREDPYANGLSTVPLSRAAAARTTVPIVPLYPNYYTPAINSTFVQQANGSWNHHTYINQAEMYFFKNNDNSSEFSSKRCRSFFKVYASDSDPELIGPEGIEKLCNDLQVKPEDIVVLVLSWKLNAKVMGLYSLSEWLEGMNELKCDSVVKLRNKLDYLRSCLSDPTLFKSIYRYSFDFAKEPEQRCLDIDVAKQMLSLLLTNRWRIFPLFVEFLNQSKYKVINKDQYFNLLDFSRLVDDDLTNYDENSAWPVMLDEFVEWCRDFKGFKVPAVESGHTSDDQE